MYHVIIATHVGHVFKVKMLHCKAEDFALKNYKKKSFDRVQTNKNIRHINCSTCISGLFTIPEDVVKRPNTLGTVVKS
jgi:hypothetical protein